MHKLQLIKRKKGSQKGKWFCSNCGRIFAFYMRKTKNVEDYVNRYYPEKGNNSFSIII